MRLKHMIRYYYFIQFVVYTLDDIITALRSSVGLVWLAEKKLVFRPVYFSLYLRQAKLIQIVNIDVATNCEDRRTDLRKNLFFERAIFLVFYFSSIYELQNVRTIDYQVNNVFVIMTTYR